MKDELDALQFGGQGGRVDEKQATHSIPAQTGKPVTDCKNLSIDPLPSARELI
jgi:hypothetical protein